MLEEKEVEELKNKLEEIFSDYYEEAGGWEYRYHHLVRTRKYAVKLMQAQETESDEFDEKVVEVAALFHDIGRKEDIEDGYLDPMEDHEGHAEKGAEIVEEHVSDYLNEERLEKVKKVIRNHHSEPETVEGKIVQDADDIGKFSSIDLWRLVHYASDNERTLEETIRYFNETLKPESEDLLEDLNLKASRKVAERRLEKYAELIETMDQERKGEDIDRV